MRGLFLVYCEAFNRNRYPLCKNQQKRQEPDFLMIYAKQIGRSDSRERRFCPNFAA